MKPRSVSDMVGGMAFFARMLDKVRLHERGELGKEYHAKLGKGGDGFCLRFLRVDYEALKARVFQGGTDEEILEWCFETGRRLDESDILVWNGFILKLGWKDFASEFLIRTKEEEGLADRDDIETIPQLMDVDEGRGLRPADETA